MAQPVKNLPAVQETQEIPGWGRFPGWGRSPGGGKWQPTPVSLLKNPMDRGAQQATVPKVAKSRTGLSMHTHMPTNAGEMKLI